MQADGYDDQPPMSHRQMRPSSAPSGSVGRGDLSIHESFRAKKKVEDNCKMIENRIRYFQREEEKIWRDLEEVRRQAAMIEDGRSRKIEKNLADRTIQQERELVYRQNQARAAQNRGSGIEVKKRNSLLSMRRSRSLVRSSAALHRTSCARSACKRRSRAWRTPSAPSPSSAPSSSRG